MSINSYCVLESWFSRTRELFEEAF